MRNIHCYIDEAQSRNGIGSDRKLGLFLGLSDHAATAWQTGRALPSDETMLKLARIANVPDWEALLDLQMWRSENENVKKAWQEIASKIKAVILGLAFVGLIGFSAPALASEKVSSVMADCVSYGK